jgi:hypothetical protein
VKVHHAAVRGIAAQDYPQEVIADWAPAPVTGESFDRFPANPGDEVRLVAEINGPIVGIGSLVRPIVNCAHATSCLRLRVGALALHWCRQLNGSDVTVGQTGVQVSVARTDDSLQ